MNHNFKPGDLALTLAEAVVLLGDISIVPAGSQVELVARGEAGEEFDIAGEAWRLRRPMWLVDREGMLVLVAERNLMPLRGDFAVLQPKAEEIPA